MRSFWKSSEIPPEVASLIIKAGNIQNVATSSLGINVEYHKFSLTICIEIKDKHATLRYTITY